MLAFLILLCTIVDRNAKNQKNVNKYVGKNTSCMEKYVYRYSYIGKRFEKVRLKNKFKTQAAIAKFLGISKQLVSAIEVGRRKPSERILELYADKFNVPKSYLRAETDEINNNIDQLTGLSKDIINKLSQEPNNYLVKFINELYDLGLAWSVLRGIYNYCMSEDLRNGYLYLYDDELKNNNISKKLKSLKFSDKFFDAMAQAVLYQTLSETKNSYIEVNKKS